MSGSRDRGVAETIHPVVRGGLTVGVPTPVHRTIAACLPVHQPSPSTKPHTHAHSEGEEHE